MSVTRALVSCCAALLAVGGLPQLAAGQSAEVSVVAGRGEEGYSGDGWQAVDARLNSVLGLAVGPDGVLYVADTLNRRLRRVTPDGKIDTVPGFRARRSPATDGPEHNGLTYSPSNAPRAAAVAPDGTLYVAGNQDIRRVGPDGKPVVIAGAGENSFIDGDGGDGGPATAAWLHDPADIAVGPDGSVYIADATQDRVRRIDRRGVITTVAGGGAGAATAGSAATDVRLTSPDTVAVGPDGDVYFAMERGPGVFRVTEDGRLTVLAKFPGSATPSVGGLTVTDDGGVLASNIADGVVYHLGDEGEDGEDGGVRPVTPRLPGGRDIAVGPDGALYIAGGARVHRVVLGRTPAQGPPAQVAPSRWAGDEPGAVHEVVVGREPERPGATAVPGPPGPTSVALAADGTVYVAEPHRHRVRRITPAGEVTAFAGTGERGADGDGAPAEKARMTTPASVAVADTGEVYIADIGSGDVRVVDTDGVIDTLARVPALAGLAFHDRLVVTADDTVLAVDDRGKTTRIAGGGKRWAEKADGHPAVEASLRGPIDVAPGPGGVVHLIERDLPAVRTVRADRTLVDTAGDSYLSRDEGGFAGDGGPAARAELNAPGGLATGPDGALYIADTFNNRVRKVGRDGVITTVAGSGERADRGDGGPATKAALTEPTAVAVADDGALVVTGTATGLVRRIAPDGTISTIADLAKAGGALPEDTTLNLAGLRSFSVDPEGAVLFQHDQSGLLRVVPGRAPERVATTNGGGVLAHGPDGALYVGSGTVVRHGPDGSTAVVLDHRLTGQDSLRIADLAVGPDGALFVRGGNSVQVLRDGRFTPVLTGLTGDAHGIGVGPDGTVYAVDEDHVVKPGPDSKPVRVAGSDDPVPDDEADGAQAAEVDFSDSLDVAVAADGTVFVGGYYGIRRIAADGTVSVVVPEATEDHYIHPVNNLVFGPGGDLFYSLPSEQRIMAVVRPAEVSTSGFPVLAVALGAGGALVVGVVLWLVRRRYHGRPSTSGPT